MNYEKSNKEREKQSASLIMEIWAILNCRWCCLGNKYII